MRRARATVALAAIALLAYAASAGGATTTVIFDDLPPNTRVSTEYQASHGLSFSSDPGLRPLVKQFPGMALSGDQV